MPENRRSQTRYQVAIEARLSIGDESHDRTIINVSLGGCHVTHDSRLPIGTRVEVSFRIPTQESPVVVGGATRWSDGEAVGVQFDGLRAREVWSLNKYFESLQR